MGITKKSRILWRRLMPKISVLMPVYKTNEHKIAVGFSKMLKNGKNAIESTTPI